MHSGSVLDIQINLGLSHKHVFLLHFQIGQDNGITLPCDYKNWLSCLLLRNIARHTPNKKISHVDVQ